MLIVTGGDVKSTGMHVVHLYTECLFIFEVCIYVRNGNRFRPMPSESFHHADYIRELEKLPNFQFMEKQRIESTFRWRCVLIAKQLDCRI